jgi:S1-C subfamily serine protease
LHFVNASTGDFRLQKGSVAFSAGFKNFSMDNFGVIIPGLKTIAKKVAIPSVFSPDKIGKDEVIDFMGAKVKNLSTLGEQSATGMDAVRGVLVVDTKAGSTASGFLQVNDVILSFNLKRINDLHDLLYAQMSVIGAYTEVVIFRNQTQIKKVVELDEKKLK